MAQGKETRAKYKNPRVGYTFTFEQRQQALEEAHYQCEHCGAYHSPNNPLVGHHLVAIWAAREGGIPQAIITSLENLDICCHTCHTRFHQQENRHQYAYLAWFLFGIDVQLDEKKDDWRKDPEHPSNKQYNSV